MRKLMSLFLAAGLLLTLGGGCLRRPAKKQGAVKGQKVQQPARPQSPSGNYGGQQSAQNPPPPPPEPDRPGIGTEIVNTVYGMGGGAAFNAGQKAKSRIKDLNQQHNRQMNDALNK